MLSGAGILCRKGAKALKHKHTEEIIGTYLATERGFGFFRPDGAEGRQEDWFVPPRAQGSAWDGDRVAVASSDEDRGEGRAAARVVRVLERANQTVTGVLEKQGRELWLRPDNKKLPLIRALTKRPGGAAGQRGAVAMTSFGGGDLPPRGTPRQLWGPGQTRASAVAALLYGHGIHRDFPTEVLDQAGSIPQSVPPEALEGRLDLRDRTIITIDGASSKDFDDGVSLEKDKAGRWVLGVHIADVSHYVKAGTPLDLEAWERGTSVYFADQVVPMLPEALSNGICSLNPRVDRLALSCLMTLSPEGELVDHTIRKSVICSRERMTYEDCNVLLDAQRRGQAPALQERYAHILPMLEDMNALAKILSASRRRRGGLDLDTQESQVLCDEHGVPVGVALRRQGESEKLIEAFMLAANECVAQHLAAAKKPCVYRVHEKPSQEKADALRVLVAPLGYELKGADGPSLQKLLDWAKGRPEEGAVSLMVLRSLMKARYDGENLGHFGLASPCYCHFTSPIRRYPDLMVHRILTALLDGRWKQEGRKLAAAVPRAALQSSQREVAAQEAEREIEKRYLAEYMAGHIGETFRGAVSGVTRFGLFVAVEGGVEGLLPLEALPGGPWEYDEAHLVLQEAGGPGRYALGTEVEVECAAADPASGQIDFTLPGGLPAPRPLRVRREREDRPRREHKKGGRRSAHVPRGRKGRKKR